MGDTDSSEAQGSSGEITSAILEQLADFQRRVVLLEGATPGAEVREAPASSPSFAPVVQGLVHPGVYLGSNRPPKFPPSSIVRGTRGPSGKRNLHRSLV